jgi:hypothetical protein
MLKRPPRMRHLKEDHRGFVVPWFVSWAKNGKPCEYGEGEPDFRAADTRKFKRALAERRCWLCGEMLGVNLAFVIGPMCAVTRVTSEPPCHLECATYAVQVCPFLTKPRMRRNEKDLPEDRINPGGIAIPRNPGACCIWVTRSFKTFRPGAGNDGVLLRLGDPVSVQWYAEGREATRAEIERSIESGYPLLRDAAKRQGDEAVDQLVEDMAKVSPLLPREARV